MIESLKNKQISSTMVKHFALMNLVFPLMYSNVGSSFAPDIVYANIFAVLFVVYAALEGRLQWKQKNLLVWAIGLLLVGFNIVAFYINKTYYGWYTGQVNLTVAFVFFMALLLMKDSASGQHDGIVRFLIQAAVITNLLGLIPYFMGYLSVYVSVKGYEFIPQSPHDICYYWIYDHKSQYSFFLVLFIALTVTYRRLFQKAWQFWASIGAFVLCLVIADTRTTMLSALFIPIGILADYLKSRSKGFSWKYLLWFLPFLVVGAVMFYFFSKERNVWHLNYRTYIWEETILRLLDLPQGSGQMYGIQPFSSPNVPHQVWNGHNVFLNLMFQFSIPAGLCCILMIFATIVESIRKNLSFRTLGIWIALLIPLNMDWCLLLNQIPMMLLLVYFVFFSPRRKQV